MNTLRITNESLLATITGKITTENWHYVGNILLADGAVCGNIKITDFGLSKQNTHGDEGIELTSQGTH